MIEEVQQLPWRLCYARDKAQPAPTAAASAGADALQVMLPCKPLAPNYGPKCTISVTDGIILG